MDRRAPNLNEVTTTIDELLRSNLERALGKRVAAVRVEGRQGAKAAVVVAIVGDERRAHELFVFARGPTGDEALDRCIDYVDGVVEELSRAKEERFLPLDWEGRPYANDVVFVRGEVRDYLAEEQAAELLGEPAPIRGLGVGDD